MSQAATDNSLLALLTSAKATLAPMSDAPDLDAERLMLFALGQKETSWLYAHGQDKPTSPQQREFERLVAERAGGKPLAYILGEWDFYGRPFYVTPDVLVPRPATEKLVEQALQYIDILLQKEEYVTVADIGTGSGIIAITLALEVAKFSASTADPPNWRADSRFNFIATDISPAALKLATKNAQRHGVKSRIEFLQGDMFTPFDFAQGKPSRIDLIVSNPPYVPTEALVKAGRANDTRGLTFEPRAALDGGADGRDFVRQIQATKIPAIVESTGGGVETFNL